MMNYNWQEVIITPPHILYHTLDVSSSLLKEILLTLLAFGNHMNGNTSRGQADAFDITTLSKVSLTIYNIDYILRYFLYFMKISIFKIEF